MASISTPKYPSSCKETQWFFARLNTWSSSKTRKVNLIKQIDQDTQGLDFAVSKI